MHRYLPGIFLVQLVTAVLLWINIEATPQDMAVKFVIPALFITLVTALWFASISRGNSERMTAKIRLEHAREREQLHVNAEKSKAKIIEKTQKEIRRNEKSVSRKASFKIGLAFFAATAAGVIMLVIELFTFGLMTIMTTAGGMGGYLFRVRQTYDVNKANRDEIVDGIDIVKPYNKLPPPPESSPTDIK